VFLTRLPCDAVDIGELGEHEISIITLYPGDVINNGISGGTGMGTNVRGGQRFLAPGEEIAATIDGIGTLRIAVVADQGGVARSGCAPWNRPCDRSRSRRVRGCA
jgi:hypothetical protein